ncbi:pilus assembly protein CpaC [Phenylobacterium haematophilum]|uniref:Pilus assembly protein CpaC n=1 Tax=Phenylobacterium haematophilum TaxID=98513 RepID=A0A839ZXK6_9CAUL|nr:type II and III secretion system protein family protein [Phenylobacterium haematophilum]MBB3889897.1 pilus assembly protein CpaC [Phenylobacterium haematophilum]
MSRVILAVLTCLLGLGCLPAQAETFVSEAVRSRTINVPKNKSLSFRLDGPASKIVVAQPDTAQIVATTDRSFYVRGKALGATNLLIYGQGGALQEVVDVRVGYDAEALQADLAAAIPGEVIKVRNLGEGLLLTGEVSTTAVAAKAKTLADKFAPENVTSALTVRASQQVILEVRVLEAGRSDLKDVGFNITATDGINFALASGSGLIGPSTPQGALQVRGSIGSVDIDLMLQALEEKGVVRTLARPNLVALSGQKASFLAGGEFPFPVPNGRDTVTIEFRQFGVKLDFEPVVQDNGLIRLLVAPEVSALDNSANLRLNGMEVPSLTVRRAATTVELKSGESFAVAGLFQQDYSNAVRQLPGIGQVPVIGALFRSARWKRHETELVIIITPRLATANDLTGDTRIMAGRETNPIDLILMGMSLDKPLSAPVGAGPAGQ